MSGVTLTTLRGLIQDRLSGLPAGLCAELGEISWVQNVDAFEATVRFTPSLHDVEETATPGRYALFVGDYYYPGGGWDDYQGSFSSLEEAQVSYTPSAWKWAHVVDLDTEVIVARQDSLDNPWEMV